MGSRIFKESLLRHNNEFEKCYVEESKEAFVVLENDDNISIIKEFTTDDKPGFKVINPKLTIGFLAFDYCFVKQLDKLKLYSGKRCDCILFTSKELLFVEMKLDVGNRRIAKGLREGRDQLSNTISYFHKHFKDDFQSFSNNAIVVLPKHPSPRISARLTNLKIQFFLDNFGVEYFEDSEFTFNK